MSAPFPVRLLAIAFRNLLRARRRNLLAGGTMVLGSTALVLGSGLSDGIAFQLTRSLVAVQTGHLQVVVRPKDFVPQNSPFDAYGPELIPGGEEIGPVCVQGALLGHEFRRSRDDQQMTRLHGD